MFAISCRPLWVDTMFLCTALVLARVKVKARVEEEVEMETDLLVLSHANLSRAL